MGTKSGQVDKPPAPVRRIAQRQEPTLFETVESCIGAVIGIVMCATLLLLLGMLSMNLPGATIHLSPAIAIPALCICAVVDFWMMMNLGECISHRRFPVALEMFERHPQLPYWLRPFASTIWVAHALVLLAGALQMELLISRSRDFAGPAQFAVLIVIFGMTFTGNVFLMLAIAAVDKGSVLAKWFWRRRIWVDALLALTAWGLTWLAPAETR
jgi:hypothetical protein